MGIIEKENQFKILSIQNLNIEKKVKTPETSSELVDIAFCSNLNLLALTDNAGNLFVYEIFLN